MVLQIVFRNIYHQHMQEPGIKHAIRGDFNNIESPERYHFMGYM